MGRRRRGALPHGELSDWAAREGVTVRPELQRAAPRAAGARPLASGDGGQPRRLHPVHALRARLPRGAGQRRHRLRAARRARARSCSTSTTRWARAPASACGECVQACPTGALMPKTPIGSQVVDKQVDSVCPFCGVGCLLTYNVRGNAIVSVDGRDGPANHERLCVKGRFGFDYASHPQRLTKPLIRKPGVPEGPAPWRRDPADWREVFREATWDEALEFTGGTLARAARHARRRSRSPASARPRAATKRPTCSRSWCAPASAATTSTTARACAMPRASRRCSRASARAR